MNVSASLTELLRINYPIIQAPMAGGITGPELVCAVSRSGCLGSIGAGYMAPGDLSALIRDIKKNIQQPYAVNLFVPEHPEAPQSDIQNAFEALRVFRDELHIKEDPPTFNEGTSKYEEQIEMVLKEKVPVCSFTFGMPAKHMIKELKNNGSIVIGTATSVMEAILLEEQGVDAIVAQGSEAGGHRGTFSGPPTHHMLGLMSLIPQICDFVKIPVIAAGGIMDARGYRAALCLGAQGVQMGTAFLTAFESAAHPAYKEAVLNAREDQVVVTDAFSGKEARGIKNQFIYEMENETRILPYPLQNDLTKTIRKAAAEQNNAEYMSLWCGQSPRLSRSQSVESLVQSILSVSKDVTL
ncbi:NAD(P)H-dependent flavin oxidoreductase [Bacillus sp. SJS]|uniref:NAD(P)H-dependent flavin oxidoreductase n=1 Tax=Bacillus sp. SJS TaxID=1423321 RepID=UPI0004DD5844|nr:nitronate monooxygenase [Bacillus sp. SJS]